MSNIIVCVGAPGSGKSTWVDKYLASHPTEVALSSDKLRAILGTGEDDQTVSSRVFKIIEFEAERLIKAGTNVLIDATNMHLQARKPWVRIAKENGAKLSAYVFLEDREILLERNKKRGENGGRDVPEYVVDRMLSNYVAPSTGEGFDQVEFSKE